MQRRRLGGAARRVSMAQKLRVGLGDDLRDPDANHED
jgi:hypothetical protein